MPGAAFRGLSAVALRGLAEALEKGTLAPPVSALGVGRLIATADAPAVAAELNALAWGSANLAPLAGVFRLLAEEKENAFRARHSVELVWTGPEVLGSTSRDTGVVARDLFRTARESVVVAGFAVYDGRAVFRELAEQMDTMPALFVRMYLNVHRPRDDTRSDAELVRLFVERFRKHDWPGSRMPELYYFPDSLDLNPTTRAVLHAKCIVADHRQVLLTSANFTEAAHNRNIESGILVNDESLASRLEKQFDSLVKAGRLLPAAI